MMSWTELWMPLILLQFAVLLIVDGILLFRLNPIFDGVFKSKLWMVELGDLPSAFIRPGIYASWVAFPKRFYKRFPSGELEKYVDKLSPFTRFLCRVSAYDRQLFYWVTLPWIVWQYLTKAK